MPTTLLGLLVAVFTLIPGYCYYAIRRRMTPTRRVSTVVEGANVIVVAMVTNTLILVAYGILQAVPWIRDHSPNVVNLLRDPAGYLLHSNSRLAYVGVWAITLLVGSTTLAIAFALRIGFSKNPQTAWHIRKVAAWNPVAKLCSLQSIERLLKHCRERISETHRVADESVWDHYFSAVAPDESITYVECYLNDGSYAAGRLAWYNNDIDDTPDRDLALRRPLVLTKDDGSTIVEPGFDQIMIVSARDIRQVVISYVAKSAIDAARESESVTDTADEGSPSDL